MTLAHMRALLSIDEIPFLYLASSYNLMVSNDIISASFKYFQHECSVQRHSIMQCYIVIKA